MRDVKEIPPPDLDCPPPNPASSPRMLKAMRALEQAEAWESMPDLNCGRAADFGSDPDDSWIADRK